MFMSEGIMAFVPKILGALEIHDNSLIARLCTHHDVVKDSIQESSQGDGRLQAC